MLEGGRLTLETTNVHLDEAYTSRQDEVAPGDYVVIGISDTGTGMPADGRPRRGTNQGAGVRDALDGQRGGVPPCLPARDAAGVPGGARARRCLFRRLRYDNLTSAVRKVLRGHRREETVRFIAFRSIGDLPPSSAIRARDTRALCGSPMCLPRNAPAERNAASAVLDLAAGSCDGLR